MNEDIIKLENIDFYYNKGAPNEVHALTDINLEIKRGEFVSFFGSSGCGKSTVLYMISGIDQPNGGKALVNGHDMTKFSAKEIAIYRQIGIGLIFQNFNLIPSLSVADNIALPMTFLGISAERRKKRTAEILNYLNIAAIGPRFPYELSGGQQQRVGIARALANDPPLILADEPTGNLDSLNANKTMELLRELNVKQKKTVILVTHEAWCLKYVDKIFYMKDGQIIKTESVKAEDFAGEGSGKGIEEQMKTANPGATKFDLLASSFSSLLLRGYSHEEVKRAEEFFKKRISGEFNYSMLLAELDKPYREGGLGLWKQKAKSVADAVEEIIFEDFEISVAHDKISKKPNSPLKEEIENIRKWILEIYKGKLSTFQTDCFDECLENRLRNIITNENFVKVLSLPRHEGGIGFSVPTSLKIYDRLEMLLDANIKKT